MVLEVVLHEELGHFLGVAEALQPAVHVAGVAEVLEPDAALHAAVVLLLEVEVLEDDRLLPEVRLLQLALLLVVLEVRLQALHPAVLHRLALAEDQPLRLLALLVPATLRLLPLRHLLRLRVDVTLANSVHVLQDLRVAHHQVVLSLVELVDVSCAPDDGQLVLEACPRLLLGDLHVEEAERPVLFRPGDLDPLEVDLGHDFVGLVDEGDVEPLDLDASVALPQELPALLRQKLVAGPVEDVTVRVLLAGRWVVVDLERVVDQLELSDRPWMLFLALDFLVGGEILPGCEPLGGNYKLGYSFHYDGVVVHLAHQSF